MKRYRPVKDGSAAYRQLWRVVDGAVRDCIEQHPEYFIDAGRARLSLNKRITGAVLGFAEQSAKGRSGGSPAADRATGELQPGGWSWLWERWLRRVRSARPRKGGGTGYAPLP